MQVVSPEEVGLSSIALARIDEHLSSRYIERGKIAGALTLVARRGESQPLSALGQMDRAAKPTQADTIFRIYSMTAGDLRGATMLHERAVFQLTDPVSRWIPGSRTSRSSNGNYPTSSPNRLRP
jgi:CubicO group peptidase (beta-lactamase class C family)